MITGLIAGWIGIKGSFGLNQILGVFMYPFALLLGLPYDEASLVAQQMAKKIVTNEFVVMGEISKDIASYTPHHRAVITTFLISFANFFNDWYDYGYIEKALLIKRHQTLYLNMYL